MLTPPTYASALGISVGDVIHTSYGTGPEEVRQVHGPSYFQQGFAGVLIVRTWPVISVGFSGDAGISSIRQDGTRWFTDSNDEIFVAKNKVHQPSQLPMFTLSASPDPYPFKPGVDYTHNVWQCRRCGDFNALPDDERLRMRWHCPLCGKKHVVDFKIILMTPRIIGKRQMNDYHTALSGYSFQEQSEIEAIGEKYISTAERSWLVRRKKILDALDVNI